MSARVERREHVDIAATSVDYLYTRNDGLGYSRTAQSAESSARVGAAAAVIIPGCWPICALDVNGENHLFFSCFLSETIVKARVAADGKLTEGGHSHAPASALLPLLRGRLAERADDQDLRWICAKLSGDAVHVDEFRPESMAGLFAAFECLFARVTEAGDQGLVNLDCMRDIRELSRTAIACGLKLEALGDIVHLAKAERGSLALTTKGRTIKSSAIHETIENLDFRVLGLIDRQLIQPLGSSIGNTFVRLQFGGFKTFPRPTCNEFVLSSRGDKSDTALAEMSLFLSDSVISRYAMLERLKLRGDSAHSSLISRLQTVMPSIMPHLLRSLDKRPTPFSYSLKFNFEDGGVDGFFSFDRPAGSGRMIITDLYMLRDWITYHYYPELSYEQFVAIFRSRIPQLFWRGSSTGSPFMRTIADLAKNPRVHACMMILKNAGDGADCKISALQQIEPAISKNAVAYLKEHGVWGQRVSEDDFGKYQMYLDIKGNASAGGTFRKFLLGNLIFKVASRRELLYDRHLTPWTDYIPVAADVSDVGEKIKWVADNPDAAATIAFSGRARMMDFTRSMGDHIQAEFEAAINNVKAERAVRQPLLGMLRPALRRPDRAAAIRRATKSQ
jgi:hypothetical protein